MNILLIHGLTGSGHYFNDLVVSLKEMQNVKICAPDLLGFGINYKDKGPFTLSRQLEYLTKEVEKEFGAEKILIIGHSMGGVLAINFAKQNKDKISGMVLLSTPLGETSSELYRELGNGKFLDWSYLILRHKNFAILACKLLCKLNGMQFFKKLKPAYISEAVFKDYRLHSWESLTQNFKNIILENSVIPIILKLNEIPILNIVATSDNKVIRKKIEGDKVINKTFKGGHNLLLEDPKTISNVIKEFILDI